MRAGIAALALVAGLASAQAAAQQYQSSPERRTVEEKDWGQWLGPFRAKLVPSLMQDFGERYLYAPANAALPAPRPGEKRVVFLGDSITDRWNLTASFPGKPYVNRGIGSQVTAQMVLRFHQDVVALKPSAVVILAGINDIQGFLQHETPEQIETNWEALADLADRHGIKVVFGALLPVNNYTPAAKDVVKERDPKEILALNAWLRAFCTRRKYGFADYHTPMADRDGLMAARFTEDGVHPLDNGYAVMAPIAQRAIEKALKGKK
ncbi:lysophospholipase L1-like esterase [Novosphingobium sp. PhB57]|uniref:GDSL-type esterase/lipase family protein n=1 Tax=Novosphingobium sp. PhB57 TaxID=2485107 RepID=UPI00104A3FE6|nr:GDSL-type esterase/lipase family protein [Novosphingobium sp. PhB57]TCU58537.1 lysophospholipase L1-like esterase [Novosphingobium sp. PhB57]